MTPHAAFPYIAGFMLACWLVALIGYLPPMAKRLKLPLGTAFFVLGWVILIGYMAWMWIALQRPPMRTQGETFLWFTLLLPGIGLLLQWRAKNFSMGAVLPILIIIGGSVMIVFTALHPDAFDKSMMPALQSPWFVPHVLVYMVAYVIFGLAALIGFWTLVFKPQAGYDRAAEDAKLLVNIGFPLLTTGMLFGAIWAKIAWGTYWGWDVKETGAFLTWAIYLAYIHLKTYTRLSSRMHLVMLTLAFVIVMGCWVGVNSLPNAGSSAHTYMNN